MSTTELTRFWIMYLLGGALFFVIVGGFFGIVMHNIRLIRAKLKSARAAIRSSRALQKHLHNKRNS